MDLQRMLDKCRRGQWRVDDLDWSRTPRPMSRELEERIVQCFTDMVEIERLAGAMFAQQRERTDDPVLRAIFASFVRDEHRHAEVARRLARYYDVHHYREYQPNADLLRFAPCLLDACRHVSPEVADVYITTGELVLDVALLRSLDDYVDDPMSHDAMRLINRDESRHVAMDYYMLERDCVAAESAPPRRGSWRTSVRAAWSFVRLIRHARPFIQAVVLDPLDVCDPDGRRMREAFKRMQLVARRPEVARRPFLRFLRTAQLAMGRPMVRRLLGPVLERMVGLDARILGELYTPQELDRALRIDLHQLADEALAFEERSAG